MHMWGLFPSSHTSPHMSPVTVRVLNFILQSVSQPHIAVQSQFLGSSGDSCTLTLGGWKGTHRHAFCCNCAYRTKAQIRKMNFCWFFSLQSSTLAQTTEGEEAEKHNVYTWAWAMHWIHPHCTCHANHLHHVQHLGKHLMQRNSRIIFAAHVNRLTWTIYQVLSFH